MNEETRLREDFRIFLWLVWRHLGLPSPTDQQEEIAYFLQHGFPEDYDPRTGRTDMVRAFRGVGKSWISAAYVDWRLWNDPVDEKVLVISKSKEKAGEFVSQAKRILITLPILHSLVPREGQRNREHAFDVRGASISQQPSLKALGINSQLPGNRATLIMPDDIETTDNARTEQGREILLRQISEFEAIKVPANIQNGKIIKPAADVVFLGTPQTEDSIYNTLVKTRGYNCLTIPARYPSPQKVGNYRIKNDDGHDVDILAPSIRKALEEKPELAGKPTDPKRFDEEDLIKREAKGGTSWFMLQYMLDTSVSDHERYPLKQNDFIVTNANPFKAPVVIQWGRHSDQKNIRNDIPNVGFTGDYFLAPLFVDSEYRDYEGSVMFVDPSGRGKDETAWAVVKVLNGYFWVTTSGGYAGDQAEAMSQVAEIARDQRVNLILVEPNYAGQVWIQAFQPILQRVWPGKRGEPGGCRVEEAAWSRSQKEVRIIETLEPLMNQHRIVLDESVARDQTLMYQLTHITRERNCLTHDDRVDALAGAVAHFVNQMAVDAERQRQNYIDDALQAMIDDFMDTIEAGPMKLRSRRGKDFEVDEVWLSGHRRF